MFKSMIHEFEEKLLNDIMNEAKDPIDASVKAAVAEWKELSKKMAVIEKISKAVSARITEVEKGLEEVVGKVKDNKAVVDGAILEYTQKKGNTTVKYKESVDYALKLVNEAQKKVLEDFIKSVTKPGAITDVLKVTDPDLEKYLIDLKDLNGSELMGKIETMARSGFDNIPKLAAKDKKKKLAEGVMDNITKVVAHLVRSFKSVFSPFFKSADKAAKAGDAFAKAVKADAMKESVEVATVEEAAKPKVIKQTPEGGIPKADEKKKPAAKEEKAAPKAEGKKKVSAAQRRKLEKTKKEFREVSDQLEALNLDTDEKIGRDHPLIKKRMALADEMKALNKELGIKMR